MSKCHKFKKLQPQNNSFSVFYHKKIALGEQSTKKYRWWQPSFSEFKFKVMYKLFTPYTTFGKIGDCFYSHFNHKLIYISTTSSIKDFFIFCITCIYMIYLQAVWIWQPHNYYCVALDTSAYCLLLADIQLHFVLKVHLMLVNWVPIKIIMSSIF